jgi:hypothetical protein
VGPGASSAEKKGKKAAAEAVVSSGVSLRMVASTCEPSHSSFSRAAAASMAACAPLPAAALPAPAAAAAARLLPRPRP